MVKDGYTVVMLRAILSPEMLVMLACPACYGKLILDESLIRCVQCGRRYPAEDGIPILLADRAISANVDERRDK
jgi:hypothetical protein